MQVLFILFIVVPILEMVILIEVGSRIGALPTVGLVLLTAVIGVWLLRLEGLATLRRVQEKLNAGQLPETELLEGIMLAVGGALLLTPGFFTDSIGFVCLIPVFRRPIARYIIQNLVLSRFEVHGNMGNFTRGSNGAMEGEFEDLTPKSPPKSDAPDQRLPPDQS